MNVVFSFSDLKSYFECPYQFKLCVLYGFNSPIHEALGYGRSLHNVLAEVHTRAACGEVVSPADVPALLAAHIQTPYAYPSLRETLSRAAERTIGTYVEDNREQFRFIEASEKPIELDVGDGIRVAGRIDLIRRLETGEKVIVDLKSNDRAQPERVTESQLQVYALGYQELTGVPADFVEVYDLEGRTRRVHRVNPAALAATRDRIRSAAHALRTNQLPPQSEPSICSDCDLCALCSSAAFPPSPGGKPRGPHRSPARRGEAVKS